MGLEFDLTKMGTPAHKPHSLLEAICLAADYGVSVLFTNQSIMGHEYARVRLRVVDDSFGLIPGLEGNYQYLPSDLYGMPAGLPEDRLYFWIVRMLQDFRRASGAVG